MYLKIVMLDKVLMMQPMELWKIKRKKTSPQPRMLWRFPLTESGGCMRMMTGGNYTTLFLSKELEEASRDGKTEYSITFHHDDDVNRTGETITHKCNFDTKVVVDSGGTNRRLRRHVVSEGIASMWELLTMKYEKPHGLSGQGFLKTLEKVWGGSESLDGKGNGLGFLFLYSLLSGEVKARAIGSSGGGWGNMGMGGGGMGGGYMMYGGKGGYSAYGGRTRSNTSDSHRFALLLTQLYKDRQTKSLPASVVNVLGRNRQVSLRMPRFKDTRKNTGVSFF